MKKNIFRLRRPKSCVDAYLKSATSEHGLPDDDKGDLHPPLGSTAHSLGIIKGIFTPKLWAIKFLSHDINQV